jgi:NAD(P)-dependent dehydrogenase (short-subunit alcohol dehydrogenase family)
MALANEWAGKGVNVNAIAPGYVTTDNTEALCNDPAAASRYSHAFQQVTGVIREISRAPQSFSLLTRRRMFMGQF